MKNKQEISIKAQVFFALLTVILIMAAIFSPYSFYTNVHSIRKSVDEQLAVAVNGALEILPPNYHERLKKGQVSDAEYAVIQKKLNDFKNRIGITYIYAMVQKPDGKIYFTADTLYKPMTEYDEPTKDVFAAFKTRKTQASQTEDTEFALVSRSVLIPFSTSEGDTFVIGADLNITKVHPLILQSLRHFALLFLLGIALVIIVTVKLTRRISKPIISLANFTKKLSDSNFSAELKIDDELPPNMLKSGEVQALAFSIDAMRDKLKEYIENLKAEAQARNLAESELKIAGGIQESFLPGQSFESDTIISSALMKPAKQAGGDLYDFFTLSDGRPCFAIGDVSGKGMPAALFMARAITLIRAGARITSSLPKIVKFINDILSVGNDSCTFITFFICAYDAQNGVLEFVNCGHNPPYIKRANGSLEPMQLEKNAILGVFEDIEFKPQQIKLDLGDLFLSYTDGVTEAIASDDSFYGEERLEEFLRNADLKDGLPAIVKNLVVQVLKFEEGCAQSDDITVLAVSRKK